MADKFKRAVDYIHSLPPVPKNGAAGISLSALSRPLFSSLFFSRAAAASAGNDDKLLFYGLYKQATAGNNGQAKPGWLDPVGRAKWSAWQAHYDKPPQQAMAEYVDALVAIVHRLAPRAEVAAFLTAIDPPDDAAAAEAAASSSSSEPLPVSRTAAPAPLRTPLYPNGAAAVPITPITMRISNGSSSDDDDDAAGSEYRTDDGEDELLRAVNASQAARDEQHSRLIDKVDLVETRLQRLQSVADSLLADVRRLRGGWLVRTARALFVVGWPFAAFAICYALLKWRRRRLRFQ